MKENDTMDIKEQTNCNDDSCDKDQEENTGNETGEEEKAWGKWHSEISKTSVLQYFALYSTVLEYDFCTSPVYCIIQLNKSSLPSKLFLQRHQLRINPLSYQKTPGLLLCPANQTPIFPKSLRGDTAFECEKSSRGVF